MCPPSGRAITQDRPYTKTPDRKTMIQIQSRVTIVLALLLSPTRVLAFCHEVDVVQGKVFRAAASAAPAVTIEWFGHSTFQITSSKGTRVLTDPHGAFDLPRPTLPQHIVTTSHQHGPHNSVHMAPGTPVILHGQIGRAHV